MSLEISETAALEKLPEEDRVEAEVKLVRANSRARRTIRQRANAPGIASSLTVTPKEKRAAFAWGLTVDRFCGLDAVDIKKPGLSRNPILQATANLKVKKRLALARAVAKGSKDVEHFRSPLEPLFGLISPNL